MIEYRAFLIESRAAGGTYGALLNIQGSFGYSRLFCGACRAIFGTYRALLEEYRALLIDYWAFLIEYRLQVVFIGLIRVFKALLCFQGSLVVHVGLFWYV